MKREDFCFGGGGREGGRGKGRVSGGYKKIGRGREGGGREGQRERMCVCVCVCVRERERERE